MTYIDKVAKPCAVTICGIVKANYRSGAQKAISSIGTLLLTSLRCFVRITVSDLETNFPKNAFNFAEDVIIPILILIH